MPSLFDLIQTAMGRGDPTAQLMAGLGQAPGQPGGNIGPIPGAPPTPGAVPSGGPPGMPPTPGGPPTGPAGAPQGLPAPPPQPQAYTSPPDLQQMNSQLAQGPPRQPAPDMVQLYMQMAQRQQASEQFNRGLGLLAASAYPGRRPDIVMNAMTGMTQDPGALIGNIMKLQQNSYLQQQQAAFQRALPDLAKAVGTTPDVIAAAGPQVLQQILAAKEPTEAIKNWTQGRQVLRQQGMSEDDINLQMPPTMLAGAGMGDLGQRQFLQGQAQALQANRQNGAPIPPQFQGDYTHYQTTMAAQGKLQADQANDLAEAQSKFGAQMSGMQDIDNRINDIKTTKEADGKTSALQSILSSPLKKAAAMGLMNADASTGFVSGLFGQAQQAAAGLTGEEQHVIEQMRQLGSNVYGTAFTSTGSRRTQPEVANITAGLSQVGRLNQPAASYMAALENFQHLNHVGMANAYGAAQRLDEAPDNLKGLVNPIYLPAQTDAKGNQVRPQGPLYTGAGGDWAKTAPAPAAAAPGGGGANNGGAQQRAATDAEMQEFNARVRGGADASRLRANALRNGVIIP